MFGPAGGSVVAVGVLVGPRVGNGVDSARVGCDVVGLSVAAVGAFVGGDVVGSKEDGLVGPSDGVTVGSSVKGENGCDWIRIPRDM
jgi:hypothetical protein